MRRRRLFLVFVCAECFLSGGCILSEEGSARSMRSFAPLRKRAPHTRDNSFPFAFSAQEKPRAVCAYKNHVTPSMAHRKHSPLRKRDPLTRKKKRAVCAFFFPQAHRTTKRMSLRLLLCLGRKQKEEESFCWIYLLFSFFTLFFAHSSIKYKKTSFFK